MSPFDIHQYMYETKQSKLRNTHGLPVSNRMCEYEIAGYYIDMLCCENYANESCHFHLFELKNGNILHTGIAQLIRYMRLIHDSVHEKNKTKRFTITGHVIGGGLKHCDILNVGDLLSPTFDIKYYLFKELFGAVTIYPLHDLYWPQYMHCPFWQSKFVDFMDFNINQKKEYHA